MRLFFALPLPDAIQRELAGLRRDLGKARWVSRGQLHVTLRFLGEVDDALAARVIEEVRIEREAAPWPRTQVRARGLGTFGGRRPRVLFAALDPPEPVVAIAASIERAVVRAGLPPEARPFTAHITLARLARAEARSAGAGVGCRYERSDQYDRVAALLCDEASFATELFEADEVILYRSTLTPTGAVHEPLQRFAIPELRSAAQRR